MLIAISLVYLKIVTELPYSKLIKTCYLLKSTSFMVKFPVLPMIHSAATTAPSAKPFLL